MYDYSYLSKDFDRLAETHRIERALSADRKFRQKRVARMAVALSDEVENIFADLGTGYAAALDMRPENIFA